MKSGQALLALVLVVAVSLSFPLIARPTPAFCATETFRVAQKVCCKYCTKGKACGNTCIARSKTCRVGPGCACDAW